MALTFDLAAVPMKLVAFPVIAGLAAGTGTLAAYLVEPALAAKEPVQIVAAVPMTATPATTEQATPVVKPAAKRSCEQQTWPYIENRCVASAGKGDKERHVRFVVASRESDTAARERELVSSDGVLRGPGVAPEANDQPVKKEKRSEARRHRDWRRQTTAYSGRTQPLIVVRPLGVYSSRF
jgi:hypothetical protein